MEDTARREGSGRQTAWRRTRRERPSLEEGPGLAQGDGVRGDRSLRIKRAGSKGPLKGGGA